MAVGYIVCLYLATADGQFDRRMLVALGRLGFSSGQQTAGLCGSAGRAKRVPMSPVPRFLVDAFPCGRFEVLW